MASKESTKEKKKKDKNSSNSKKAYKIPRSVQDSIPYETVFPNGIIKNNKGEYSKSYKLTDVNYATIDQALQEAMYLDYEGFLNGVDPSMTAQITVFNRSVNQEVIRNKVLLHPQNDNLNVYRDDYNRIMLSKMAEGRNNLVKEKYITISMKASNIKDATVAFNRVDADVSAKISRINKDSTPPMTIEERLGVLYDIYNNDTEMPFDKKIAPLKKDGVLDLATLNRAGLTTKDLIGPAGMSFSSNTFTIGNQYAKAFFLDDLPTSLNDSILTDLTDIPCNMITSIIYKPIPSDKAALDIKHKLTSINENIVRSQKQAARGGYASDILPSELKRAKEEAETLRSDMQARNQKMFFVSVIMIIFADSKEELKTFSSALKTVGITHLAQVKELMYMQESGLNSALPFASLDLNVKRWMNTESASAFMPFSVEEIMQDGGTYYGVNAQSRNLILYNKMSASNPNSLILGIPGSGKSMSAKMAMTAALLNSKDDVFVIDPEGEYRSLADAFGGQVIKIALGADTHINPLDMDVQYAGDSGDPIAMKCDYLVSICETIVGHGNLNPLLINAIQRCGRRIYKAYYDHMRDIVNELDENGDHITCDYQAMPTLVDFYQELLSEKNDPNAQLLANAIEMYCVGNYDLFSHQTNIDRKSRFIIYDIKDIPAGMKELALQVCLNDVWNRIISNHVKDKNKKTQFFIDEFYLLLRSKSSAQFLTEIYKRSRKWGGIPCAITQNIEDLLTNDDARTILLNSQFVMMLNQSQIDRAALKNIYNISDTLVDYITDKPAGTGLLYTGRTIVPFNASIPRDSKLYKIFSTKVEEDAGEKKVALS